MHTALCHTLPPPGKSPAMIAALRQRSGIAATAVAGLLPNPLLVLAASRTDIIARGAVLQHTQAVRSGADEQYAQAAARTATGRRFASGRSRDWSPDQREAREVNSSVFRQLDESDHTSQPSQPERARGSGRGRGRSGGAGGRSGDGTFQRQPSAERGSSAGSGQRGAAKPKRGGRTFGGLPSAAHRRSSASFAGANLDDVSDRSRSSAPSSGDSRRQHSAAGSQHSGRGRHSGGLDRQQMPKSRTSGRRPAELSAAAAAAAAAAAMSSAVPDPVPRSAGITGGRWDANDAELVERSLKDAETLRRKFADQGARPAGGQPPADPAHEYPAFDRTLEHVNLPLP